MEGGIKYGHLRNIRKGFGNSPDAQKVGRVVKRSYVAALDDLVYHRVIYELAAEELLSAVHYAMPNGLDVLEGLKHAVLLVHKRLEHHLDPDRMVGYRHLPHIFFLAGGLMLYAAALHTDPLDKTLCKKIIDIIVLHIEKLILQR